MQNLRTKTRLVIIATVLLAAGLGLAVAMGGCTTTNTQGDLTLKQPPAVRY